MGIKTWVHQQDNKQMQKEMDKIYKKLTPGDELDIYCSDETLNLALHFTKIANGHIYGIDRETKVERSCPLESITALEVNMHRTDIDITFLVIQAVINICLFIFYSYAAIAHYFTSVKDIVMVVICTVIINVFCVSIHFLWNRNS